MQHNTRVSPYTRFGLVSELLELAPVWVALYQAMQLVKHANNREFWS